MLEKTENVFSLDLQLHVNVPSESLSVAVLGREVHGQNLLASTPKDKVVGLLTAVLSAINGRTPQNSQ